MPRTILNLSLIPCLAIAAACLADDSPAKGNDPATPEAPAADAAPAVAPALAPTGDVTVDAMVGQIYGKPIYAQQVFKQIGEETLTRLGTTLPRLEFKVRAARLIDEKVMEWLIDKLRIAEAMNALSEREQQGLAGVRKAKREELIAKYGGGVPALAERTLIQKSGFGLDEMVERYVQGMVLGKYRQEKIYPKTSVNKREVERYYHDHEKDFNPPPTVTIRLIVARDASTADKVDEALAKGRPFEEVARELSAFRASDGGLLEPFKLKGPFSEFDDLGWKPLNEKVRVLSEGQHTGRTEVSGSFYWAKVEKLQTEKPRTLDQCFLEIEKRLKVEKEDRVQRKLVADLLERGNYTSRRQMADALLDVAMVRYAKAQ